MSFLVTPSSLTKGERNDLVFDRDAFLFAVNITDEYFANDLNWKRVVLVYTDPSKKQKQRIVVKDWNRGIMETSELARTGIWSLHQVQIFDKDLDLYTVDVATDVASPEQFDVDMQRLIAPAAPVSAVEIATNLNMDSTFDVATVEDAGWTQIQENGSAALIVDNYVGEIKLEEQGTLVSDQSNIEVSSTAGLQVGDLVSLDGGATFVRSISAITNGTWFAVNPAHGNSSNVPGQDIVVASSDFALDGKMVELSTDPASLNTIKLQKSFVLEKDERYVLKFKLREKGAGEVSPEINEMEPSSGYVYEASNKSARYNGTTDAISFTWNGIGVYTEVPGEGNLTTVVGADGWTYERGPQNHTSGSNIYYQVRRYRTIPAVPGIINDLAVRVLDEMDSEIASQIYSVADNSEQMIDFMAVENTKVSFECSGQDGFWALDDVLVEKHPDAVTVDLVQVQHYREGYKVMLWDDVAGAALTPDIYTITKINNDKITFDQPIKGSYQGKTLRLKFPPYSEVSGIQRSLYQYVGVGH